MLAGDERPNPWLTLIPIALIVVSVCIGISAGMQEEAAAKAMAPKKVRCWRLAHPLPDNYDPAYWLERHVVADMVYEVHVSIRCTGKVNGQMVVWDAEQEWVKRSEAGAWRVTQ